MSFKSCSKCKRVMPVCFGHFYRQKSTSDGHTSWCRDCDREKSKLAKRKARLDGKIKNPSPERSRQYTKKWREKNIEKAKELARISQRKRMSDPTYRAMSNIGRRIRQMVRGKIGSTRYLPYNSTELKRHIEKQFSHGMSWENYGSHWHIDHIVPMSLFDASDPISDDFQSCWALSNLRPLSAFENLSKSNKQTHLI